MVKESARWFTALAVLIAVATFYLTGASALLDRPLLDWRFRLLERPASGGIVIVQIDARSLRELGVWPWPRTYHAEVLDRLLQAGASEVAIDIDFSTRSTEDADRALAAALARAGSRAILPTFRQAASPEAVAGAVFDTSPRFAFSEHVQIGSTNISPASDGLIRSISDVQVIDGVRRPAMFALLAGPSAILDRTFDIDFAIDPATIPRLSYVDVLRGDFAAGLIAGKKVVLGATAAELGDTLPVPVHHSMSGPVLQVLAYESVVQGRALQTSGLGVALLGSVLLLLVFAPFFATRSWRSDIAVGVTAMVGLEAGATALQSIVPVAVLTAPWMFTILLCFIVAIARRVEAQAREILTQRQAIVTRQALMDRMMENSFDGVVIADCGGQIAVFNEAAGEILKYQVKDAVGRPLDQLLPGATHSAAEFDILAADGVLLNHIGPQEWGVIRGDGTTTYIELFVGQVRLDV